MAKISVTGLDEMNQAFSSLVSEASEINSLALYDAAGVAKDAIAEALAGMPTHDESQYGTESNKLYGATPSEKTQIIQNFGVAHFRRSNGSTDTSIGFKGYVNTKSKRFNNHVPTGMLMQCIEYGTSFRRPTRTISNAIKSIRDRATQAAQERIDQEIQKRNLNN